MDDLGAILLLQGGFALNMVLFSALCLGACAALIGVFFYLRKDILIADALSHATLPGIGAGFLLALALGINGGMAPAFLLIGAFASAVLGGAGVQWITRHTRLSHDSAIASVLSVFYAAGIVLFSGIQRLDNASQAGLNHFLLGQIAGMQVHEAFMICALSIIVLGGCVLYFRDFLLLSFDQTYAQCLGRPTTRLDKIMLGLMLGVICLGLKTVGLVLILALLVMPAAIARFWSARIVPMSLLSVLIGAGACYGGAALSAFYKNAPTGSTIILVLAAMLVFSFVFGVQKGLLFMKRGANYVGS